MLWGWHWHPVSQLWSQYCFSTSCFFRCILSWWLSCQQLHSLLWSRRGQPTLFRDGVKVCWKGTAVLVFMVLLYLFSWDCCTSFMGLLLTCCLHCTGYSHSPQEHCRGWQTSYPWGGEVCTCVWCAGFDSPKQCCPAHCIPLSQVKYDITVVISRWQNVMLNSLPFWRE